MNQTLKTPPVNRVIRRPMNLQTLPHTDLCVSEICLGGGDLGGQLDRTTSFALLDRYVELGGNFIDTAHIYNNWIPGERSRSEKMIGSWMHARRNRENLVISTKGAHPDLRHMERPRSSNQEILEDLEESLLYLQVDCIDLYWLHRDDPARPVEELVELLAGQVKAGKIRYAGVSNWKVDRLRAAQEYAASAGLLPFAADQVLWNAAVIDRAGIPDTTIHVMDRALWEYHLSTGLAAIPYTSQANGLFNKIETGRLSAANRDRYPQYPYEANQARYAKIHTIGIEMGLSTTQVVLGYLLSQPFTTIPIVGPKTIPHLDDSMRAAGIRLSTEQINRIEQNALIGEG
jgi:aryl-alcohol dehydrogenase-like predicted oxidoreductase